MQPKNEVICSMNLGQNMNQNSVTKNCCLKINILLIATGYTTKPNDEECNLFWARNMYIIHSHTYTSMGVHIVYRTRTG